MDAETLREAMGRKLPLARYAAALDGFNAALVAAGCTNVPRSAMYCAQVGHESLGLFYQEEVWGPTTQQKRYDPTSGSTLARQLGNDQPGDGARFKGRGRIQLTGKGNYLRFGQWCRARGLVDRDDHFVRRPDLVATSPWCDLAAAWYWAVARPRLNAYSDAGDLTAATKAINGGTNGIDDRRARLAACLRLGARLLPNPSVVARPAPPPPRPKGPVKMIDRQFDGPFPGPKTGRIIIPVGNGAQAAQAWFSCSFDGGVHVKAWFQDAKAGSDAAAPGTRAPIDWRLGNAERGVVEVPVGTEFIQYELSDAEGPGAILIETRSA